MQRLTNWSTKDKKQLIYIDPNALELMISFQQDQMKKPEAGGILLGKVRGSHLEVVEVTTPSIQDKQSRFMFERSSLPHKEIANDRWQSSLGTVRYIGEWHTHPEDFPTPSALDISEWKDLARNRVDKRPLLAIIIGRLGIHMEYVFSNGKRIILINLPN